MYKKMLFGIAALALVSVLFAACTIRDAASDTGGPTVHMGGSSFIQTTITIPKGSKLTIVDDTTSPHIVLNGKWDASNKQVPSQESGAPKVLLNFNGGDTGSTPPFTQAGTYDLYCSVHQGMNLVVTVQ